MARKSKAAVQPVTVNPEKIVRGLTTVFQGFSIMFDGMAEQMQLMQDMTDQLSFPGTASPVGTPKEVVKAETTEVDEVSRTEEAPETERVSQASDSVEAKAVPQDEDTPPWEASQKQDDSKQEDSEAGTSHPDTPELDTSSTSKPAMTITQADLTQVIVAKIKLNRSNNGKIGKLLGAYGVSLLSDLPAEKYEAFLNDLSQL